MATKTLTRGQKAAATRKANLEKKAAAARGAKGTASVEELLPQGTPELIRRTRTTTAPAVKPMFSDKDDEKAALAKDVADTVSADHPHLTEVPTPKLEEEQRAEIEEEDESPTGLTPEEIAKIKKPSVALSSHIVPGKVAMVTMTPDKLHELAFVSTYTSQDEQSSSPRQHGYQREPVKERFPSIGRYYAKANNRHLITPIIASARIYKPEDQVRFNQLLLKGDMKTIHKEFGKSVFSIVDGQHREGGLFWAWENFEDFNADVPIMVFYGLHYADEANLFDDINTNQRKLPKALIEATKVHMESGDKSHAQVIREIAFALAQDGDSVWHGLVNMTGARDPEKPVTYEGLRRSTSNMLNDRLISRLEARGFRPENVAKKYWELVSKSCSKAWNNVPRLTSDDEGNTVEEAVKYRIKDLVGVAAVSRLGNDILNTSLEKGKTEDDFNSSMADLVTRLGAVDWEKQPRNPWMASSAGFAGMGVLYDMLYKLVYLDQAPGVHVAAED
jgi:DGQHR domain-containing protein